MTGRAVTIAEPTLPGFVPDVEAMTIVRAYHARIDDYGQGNLALPTLPSAQERAVLEQRDAELARMLKPISYAGADRERAMRAFGRLWLGYPTLENVDKMEKSATYTIDLGDLPAFAIEMAVEDIKKGRIKDLDMDYPPSSPRVYKIADAHRVKVYADEKRPIERVLSVKMLSKPQQTAAQEQRVGELMRGLASTMTATGEERDREVRTEFLNKQAAESKKMVEREWRSLGLEPVQSNLGGGRSAPISVALARSLKILPEAEKLHPNDPRRR